MEGKMDDGRVMIVFACWHRPKKRGKALLVGARHTHTCFQARVLIK